MDEPIDMNHPFFNGCGCILLVICAAFLFCLFTYIGCKGNRCTEGIGEGMLLLSLLASM